jgi:tetratricopeptide (TPR) repeat protein
LLLYQNTHIFFVRNSVQITGYMKIFYLKFCVFFLLVWLLIGCSSTQKMVRPKPSAKKYNKEALNHIIDGAIADLIGSPKDAIVNYQQAAEIDTSSPGIYLALAENYYILDELKTSIRLANRALRLDPVNIEALELSAAAYEKMSQYKNALTVYKRLVDIQPNDLNSLYSLASMQIVSRDYDDAFDTYQAIVRNGLDEADFRLRLGHLFLKSRAFAQAEKVYLDIQNDHPKFEPVYLALAATQKARKDTTAALAWYVEALQNDIGFSDAKAELRVLYEKSKRWDEAINVFTELAQRDSANITTKLQLGQFYLQKGDTLSARDLYKTAVDIHPLSERAYLALGAVEKMRGDTTAAIKAYQIGLEKRDRFLDIRRRLRDIFVKRKQFDQAISLYSPLTDSDSTFVGARIEISNLLMQKGDTLKALQEVNGLNETHGDDWRVPLTLGRFYFIMNKSDEAIPYLLKARDKRQDVPYLWILVGINYIQIDSLDLAMSNFRQAAKRYPDDPEINYYLGSIHARKNEFKNAIPYFEKSNKKDPHNVQTLLALAGAYDENKQYSIAETIYNRLLEKNPTLPIVLNNYAYHLSVQGIRLTEAQRMSQKALKADPENAPYLDTLGWIYYQMGDYDNAKNYTLKSLAFQKDSPEVLEHLGDIYFKSGDQSMADKYWKEALNMDNSRRYLLDKIGSTTP